MIKNIEYIVLEGSYLVGYLGGLWSYFVVYKGLRVLWS